MWTEEDARQYADEAMQNVDTEALRNRWYDNDEIRFFNMVVMCASNEPFTPDETGGAYGHQIVAAYADGRMTENQVLAALEGSARLAKQETYRQVVARFMYEVQR